MPFYSVDFTASPARAIVASDTVRGSVSVEARNQSDAHGAAIEQIYKTRDDVQHVRIIRVNSTEGDT